VQQTTTLLSGRAKPGIVADRGLSYGPSLSSDGR
jgi:hypothetical protein